MQGISTAIRLVDQMTAPLMSINRAIDSLTAGFENVETASNIDTASLDIMRHQVEMLGFAAEQSNQVLGLVGETIEEMTQGQNGFNNSVREGHGAADGLTKKLMGAVAAYASIQGVKKVLDISDTLTQTTARLNMMNDGLQTTQDLQNMIFLAAERSRGSYQATADAVGKIGIMARDAFSSNAELIAFTEQLNKQFTIAGTSTQGIDAAMLQLTQAMGSGVLRGEELNSVFEQAPTIIQTIADYLDVPIGKIREMASDGEITASIVKNAMLGATDEINAQFDQMPMTFGQIATSMKNQALMAFQPVLNRLNEIANSPSFDTLVSNVTSALVVVAGVVLTLFEMIGAIAQFANDNWSWLAPIIGIVTAGLAAYLGYLVIANTVEAISNGLKVASVIASYAKAAATGAEVSATTAATAAQMGLNAALLACPLTWILIAIIAIIGAIYLVIGIINQAAGTSISATGVIFGAFTTLGAFLWNLFLGLLELVLGVINYLVNPFIEFANFIGNVFTNPISSIIYLFQGMADNVLAILQKIASALDFVFGSSMADAVAGWRSGLKDMADAAVAEYAPDENYSKVMDSLDLSVEGLGLKRWAYGDAWDTGYTAGQSVDDAIANFDPASLFDSNIPNAGEYGSGTNDLLSQIAANTSDTANNTGKQLDFSEEELKYIRDVATRDTINRYTIAVDLGGFTTNNTVNSEMDLDGIARHVSDYIGENLEETLLSCAEGIHL